VAGAVNCPPTGETWFTQDGAALKRIHGGPAEPVRVRAWPTGAAVALISHTMKEEHRTKLMADFACDHTLAMDSSIKFCRLAEGGADVYPRHGPTMEWDIAAGHAVLEAAGGSVRGLDDGPFGYGKAQAGFRNPGFVARGG
jgi:3'(2'), 5'-bisphosphate nucleotidase